MKPRKVYDCFTFWKEFDVLEIRLNELYNVVDKFIIIESSRTHTGDYKPFYLKDNIEQFKKFKDKIHLISDSRYSKRENPNRRQNYQRNLISTVLKQNKPSRSDLIIISDCDEIPRASTVQNLIDNPMNCIFELDGYIGYYNLYFEKWHRGRAMLYADFEGAQKAHRDYFIQTAQYMRRFKIIPLLRINKFFAVGRFDEYFGAWVGFTGKKTLPIIKNAGWHFTKMFSPEIVIESITASSHTEFNINKVNVEFITNRRQEHKNYYGGEAVGTKMLLDNTFPEFLLNNKKKYQSYLL